MPTKEDILYPILVAIAHGNHKLSDIYDDVAAQLNISPQHRLQMSNKGQNIFENRVRWAQLLLVAAGLAERSASKRGYLQITDDGQEVLSWNLPIDINILRLYKKFRVWETEKNKSAEQKYRDHKVYGFLRRIGAVIDIDLDENAFCYAEGCEESNVFEVNINFNGKNFNFNFVQDPKNTKKGIEPTAYDVLSITIEDKRLAHSMFGNNLPKLITILGTKIP